jgi:hypothetical protein
MEKISAATLLESSRGLVGQSSPPIRLRTDHSAQVMVPFPSHTLNTDIKLASGVEKNYRGTWLLV